LKGSAEVKDIFAESTGEPNIHDIDNDGSVTAIADDRELRNLLRAAPIVFEGAQGVLLDEWREFHPYKA
jgi:adenylosuccinate synthase